MATPKQIRQRLGWAVAQEGNAHDAVAKMREHLDIAMADLNEYIAEPEPERDPNADALTVTFATYHTAPA